MPADSLSIAAAPHRAAYRIVDDFLPIDAAQRMRAGIDAHFANPETHRSDTHQIWNYWFVPGQYIYMRTNPEKLMERSLVDGFVEALRAWSVRALGMSEVTWPYLSLYINGCRQGVHNDSVNGHFAFVYSLTRDDRRSTGGETMIFHEGDLFRRGLQRAAAGSDFFVEAAPRFNRLVVFDDRILHAVSPVEGPMDPREGRFVFHGHIRSVGALVEGALTPDAVDAAVQTPMGEFFASVGERLPAFSGVLMLRLSVAPSGAVATCDVLLDRVIATGGDDADWDALLDTILARVRGLHFPQAPGATTVTLPIALSGGQ